MNDFRAKPRTWMPLVLASIPVALVVCYLLFGILVVAVASGVVVIAWFLAEAHHFPDRAPKGQDHMTQNPGKARKP